MVDSGWGYRWGACLLAGGQSGRDDDEVAVVEVRGLPAISSPIVMTRLSRLSVNELCGVVYTDEVMLFAVRGGWNKYGFDRFRR